MPTKISLLGWEAVGFRCPDHQISLLNAEQPCSVTLIQMPNGTGKTTVLNLLRSALAGQPSEGPWNRGRMLELQKKDSTSNYAVFTLHLLFNERRLTIEMTFDFDTGDTPRYTTTFGAGMQDGFNPPQSLRHLLRPEFVNFFVFDGELAGLLLNRNETKASKAIEDLFEITLLDGLSRAIENHWSNTTEMRGATEDRGLTRRKNKVDVLRELLNRRKIERADLQMDLHIAQYELKEQDQKFSDKLVQNSAVRERLLHSEAAEKQARGIVENQRKGLLIDFRNPHYLSALFAQEMLSLKESFDRVKLPESTAREFFEELSAEENCVCGRPLDAAASDYIRKQASKYLGSEDMVFFNTVKHDIVSSIGINPASHEAQLQQQIDTLITSIREHSDAKTAYEAIISEEVQDDPSLDQAKKSIDSLNRLIWSLEEDIKKYDQDSVVGVDDQIFSTTELRKRLDEAETKYDEIRGTLSLRKQRDVLKELLNRAKDLAQDNIRSEICDQTNQAIAELLPNNKISVARIDNSIHLDGQDSGSVGENLSVGYAFLATLFTRSKQIQLPFVVDSPAGPLDLRVREKVALLIPKLSHQYIAFTISTERAGFLEPLEQALVGNIHYFTLFRKGSLDVDVKALNTDDYSETVDGICVLGSSFFKKFHIEDEGALNAI